MSYQREGVLRRTVGRGPLRFYSFLNRFFTMFFGAWAFSSGDIFFTSLISSSKNCCLVTHCGSGFLSFKGTSHTVDYMLNSARNRLLVHHLSILSRTRLCHAVALAQGFCAKFNGTLSGLSRLPATNRSARSHCQKKLGDARRPFW